MATARINGIDLYYEARGKGAPLMLIAGLGSDSQSWQPVVDALARHHLVITMDNRGVGRTSPPEPDISIERMADDCAQLIKHLALPSASLIGHSMGGFIALDCAIRHPECVERLILAGTSTLSSRRNHALLLDWVEMLETGVDLSLWFRNIFYWVMSRRFFEDEQLVEKAIRAELAYPYQINPVAFRRQAEAIDAFDCTETVSSIHAKTLVVAGGEDLLFPLDECSRLARAIEGAELVVLDKQAHSLYMEKSKDFIDCVLAFLAAR